MLLAAAFWTWVWGPLGLLMSTPLTMCVVVLGRHVEHLRFLDTLLGDRPALSAEEHFYLHLLKGNPDELAEHAELFLKRQAALQPITDDVAVKAAGALAQLDIDRGGALSEDARDKILLTIEGLVENLAAYGNPATDPDAPARDPRLVLCVAGRSPVDQAAAGLLKSLLSRHGIDTRVISPDEASPANIGRLDATGVTAICLSYLEPQNPANARFLTRRLRKHIPGAPLIAGFWGLEQTDTHYLDWLEATGSDFIACNLTTTVGHIAQA